MNVQGMFATVVVILAGRGGLATTLTVGPADEAEYQHIQDAVDAAQDGDEIVVFPGIYTTHLASQEQVVDLLGKAVTLRSCDGPEATIIDGEGVSRGIVCAGGETAGVVVDGFSIVHGVETERDIDGDDCVSGWEQVNGGGMMIFDAEPTVRNCRFQDNSAVHNGGGVYARASHPVFENCMFNANMAEYRGGAISNRYCTTELNDCLFEDNESAFTGGAVHNRNSELVVLSGQFRNNATGVSGGAIYGDWNSLATLLDVLFCGNTSTCNGFDHVHGDIKDLGGNCFSDSCDDADGNGYPDGCDPCLAGGATDSDGDGLCDSIDPCPHYAGPCEVAAMGGRVLLVPLGESIQATINLAQDGDTVLLENGTYHENIDTIGKAITVRSRPACQPGEGATINGSGTGDPVVTCASGEGPGTRLIGLTLTGGLTENGGGMYIWNAGPSVHDCRVEGNDAYGDGGGIYIRQGNPDIRRCILVDNYATAGGGGMCVDESQATVTECRFENNGSGGYGGGVSVFYDGHLTIHDCLFLENTAPTGGGGGLACVEASVMMVNCQFTSNFGLYDGGGFLSWNSRSDVNNCVFDSNTAYYGAGLSGVDFGVVNVAASLFCNNRDPDGLLRNIDGYWTDLGGNTFTPECTDPGCPTDFNYDGVTNVDDILILLDRWGPCLDPDDCVTDVNQNGITDCPDLLATIAAWGPCP